ncbi:hypothetical protein BHU72_11650 [Desulfuribacillus stibiiarsenatis]|uniref:Putative Flp pilus-assembly TadG-like N-terminal domain-containing protein n=1 Tax=Desulfuribacillus stibiiarsenatis TaxID=1390249 RepID=A0A1E5L7R5_9FIRM|nr:Tad domain-containing protein [Desulfuribacillus stibiiarsenatis]OEH86185.1 hypothetical protein BHU72_11650 [Desulfuribacillus stibiiarsenatis]
MIRLIKKLTNEQKGSAIILVSLAFMGLLAMTGLVLDGGSLYVTKSHLQKTANAAVLSGAQELNNATNRVHDVVNQILVAHNEPDSIHALNVVANDRVVVELSREVPLNFMSLFGIATATVDVEAKAGLGVMGTGAGAAPLGIDDSVQLNYYSTYKLKVDQTGVDSGVFGVLALGGTGASTYEDNLRFGYKNEIKVNDILDTQTGNISGKTRTSINERIQKCPYQVNEYHHKDCPRILLVPVYTPHEHTQNQLKQVRVTGFAYFYITEPMGSNDTSITGVFIKKTGRGVVSATGSDRGAYVTRLIQ